MKQTLLSSGESALQSDSGKTLQTLDVPHQDDHRKSSIVHAIALLPGDSLKENIRPMGKIYLRAKKLVYGEWKGSSIFFKILFCIEAPFKFLV